MQAALDKARPNMPVQPLPKSAEIKTIKSGPQGKAQAASQQKASTAKPTKVFKNFVKYYICLCLCIDKQFFLTCIGLSKISFSIFNTFEK